MLTASRQKLFLCSTHAIQIFPSHYSTASCPQLVLVSPCMILGLSSGVAGPHRGQIGATRACPRAPACALLEGCQAHIGCMWACLHVPYSRAARPRGDDGVHMWRSVKPPYAAVVLEGLHHGR